MSEQRLDKWLWCARLVRTRSGGAIAEGKVRINGERTLKPSRLVHDGDVVTSTASGRLFVVRILAWTARRGPPSLARTLYEETDAEDGARPRPTKRDRRRFDALHSLSSKTLSGRASAEAGLIARQSPSRMEKTGNIVLSQPARRKTGGSLVLMARLL
jgi:ribosome-associated heat shock protein Hsp15